MKKIFILCFILFWVWFVYDCCETDKNRSAELVKQKIEEETKLTDIERLSKSLYYAERNLITGGKVLEKYITELNTRMYLFQLGEVQRRRERVKDIEKKLKNAVEQERKFIKGGKL